MVHVHWTGRNLQVFKSESINYFPFPSPSLSFPPFFPDTQKFPKEYYMKVDIPRFSPPVLGIFLSCRIPSFPLWMRKNFGETGGECNWGNGGGWKNNLEWVKFIRNNNSERHKILWLLPKVVTLPNPNTTGNFEMHSPRYEMKELDRIGEYHPSDSLRHEFHISSFAAP